MIGVFLDVIVAHLREELDLTSEFCSLQMGGFPPATALEFHLAVYDEGIDNLAPQDGQYFQEEVSVVVGCWVRSQLPVDRQGELMGYTNKYKTPGISAEIACRKTIQQLAGEPARWTLQDRVNMVIEENPTVFGDCIFAPLRYVGMGPMESHNPKWQDADSQTGHVIFWGRRVRFRGLTRAQDLRIAR